MALPTSYNEATLALYMITVLGGLAETLGLTTDDMSEAVNDVAAACNVTDVADVTDMTQVRALAKVAALRVAQTMAAGWYDFSADGGDYKRSQVQKQVADLLRTAENDALLYAPEYGIQVGTLNYVDDPYPFATDDVEDV
jgi:hypothetical protein